MSNRDTAYPVPNRYRRSPPDLNTHSSAFPSGQSGRTVLPPLSSAFGTSYGESQHEPLVSSRMSPSRNEVFSPSYPHPNYPWPNSGHATMAGHSSYTNYAPFEIDPRYPTQTSHSPYPMRQSPGIPAGQESLRRPTMAINQPIRDDPWAAESIGSSYPANFALSAAVPETGNFHAPSSYPMNYDSPYHSTGHQSSYPPLHNPTLDTRHHQHAQHSMHYPEVHAHPHSHRTSPNEWAGGNPQRIDTHLVSPYARGTRDQMSHSPQEPSPVEMPVKKKRKRADAAQLKVLNDVYARTAFPTTEERLELAKKLEMSPRSVQIWFQNKRQSTRQSRSSGSSLPPMLHHPYAGGSAGPQSIPSSTPGAGPSGAREVSVSPSRHGGVYASHSPGHSHRVQREVSPRPPPPPPESMHRGRSPEGSGRPRRLGGY